MVEAQQPTQPFAPPHRTTDVIGRRGQRRPEQPVADALMVPLQVVVLDIFGDKHPQVPLAQLLPRALVDGRARGLVDGHHAGRAVARGVMPGRSVEL